MRFIFIGIFVFFFVAMPMYLLDNVLMPELNGLQQSYADAGQVADKIVSAPSAQ